MKQKITIKEIADYANVSISTVSRVVNGHDTVAEDKRRAVEVAIKALDYQPNLFARGLAGGQSNTIGVVTQDISSPFYDSILRGIRQGLNDTKYYPLFADGNWLANKEQEAIGALRHRRVDGLIVLGGVSPTETLLKLSRQIPLVVVGRKIPALIDQCVYLDNFSGAYQATQYLLGLGHQRIVYITGILSHHDAMERLKGYTQAMTEAGLSPVDDLIIEGDFKEQSGMIAVEMLFSQGRLFSAIFAGNDQTAIGVKLALYRRGIRVPDDISLIGFDDQLNSAFVTPPLTTVRQPSIEIGEAAAKTVLQLLNGETTTTTIFPSKLVIRESATRLQ